MTSLWSATAGPRLASQGPNRAGVQHAGRGGDRETERLKKESRKRLECLLEQTWWPARRLRRLWSFHLRSSGFYIPATHQRSHLAEEVLRRPIHWGLRSPAVLRLRRTGVP